MLLSFRVANHRSLRLEQELSLRPVYAKGLDALPIVAVYGSNAAGKSNLLDALGYMRSMVCFGGRRPGRFSEETPYRYPFALDALAQTEDSSYVVDLRLERGLYNYGFAVNDERVVEEWLYAYPQGRRRLLFERSEDGVTVGSGVRGWRALQTLASKTRPSRLVLSGVDQFEAEEWQPVADWFRRGLRTPGTVTGFANDLRRYPELGKMLKVADVGIREVVVEEREVSPSEADLAAADELETELEQLKVHAELVGEDVAAEFEDNVRRTERRVAALRQNRSHLSLAFYHNRSTVPLSLADQSDGTVRFMRFMSAVLDALKLGRALVIDEIEASLHPRLLFRVIELFRDPRTNTGGGQLLFTTHDTTLLGTSFGEPVLDRDEIWFTEKDKDGQTKLFPLSEFKPRKGENAERRYLGGSYGAVPAVFPDSLVDAMLTAQEEAPE